MTSLPVAVIGFLAYVNGLDDGMLVEKGVLELPVAGVPCGLGFAKSFTRLLQRSDTRKRDPRQTRG